MKHFKFALHKGYFEKGYALMNWFKLVIAAIGVTNYSLANNINLTIILIFLYFIFCYFLGWYWYNHGFALAETEVANQYNQFVKDMRNGNI